MFVRLDLYNAFNQDNYGVPVNSLSNPAFGTNTNNWGNRSALHERAVLLLDVRHEQETVSRSQDQAGACCRSARPAS